MSVEALSSSSSPRGTKDPFHNVPLVRLQVWHFSKAGRSFQVNSGLVESFSDVELSGWVAQPSKPSSRDVDRRDEFVPAEVDFQFQPSAQNRSPATPDDSMRMLFYEALPPFIDAFFRKKGKKLQHQNMFPLGVSVNRHTIIKYTHCQVLHSLAVDYQLVANVLNGVSDGDFSSQEITYREIAELPHRSIQGRSLSEEWLAISNRIPTSERDAADAREALWETIRTCHLCYSEFQGSLENDTAALLKQSPRRSSATDTRIGNQDLYLAIAQTAVAFQILSFCKKEMGRYEIEFLLPSILFRCCQGGVIFVARTYAWSWSEWYEFASSWGHTQREICVIFGWALDLTLALILSPLVLEFGRYLMLFDSSTASRETNRLRIAQSRLAARFCTQVLKMPPEIMTTAERKAILSALGVDLRDETAEMQQRSLNAFLSKLA